MRPQRQNKIAKSSFKSLKALLLVVVAMVSLYSCNGGTKTTHEGSSESNTQNTTTPEQNTSSDPMSNKGIGPVKSVSLGDINSDLVKKGEKLYNDKCSSCHKLDTRVVGPPLKDVTKRRSAEWIMNMILNPNEMTQQDPIAKQLLAEYVAPMANQSLTEEEARAILEYFRNNDK